MLAWSRIDWTVNAIVGTSSTTSTRMAFAGLAGLRNKGRNSIGRSGAIGNAFRLVWQDSAMMPCSLLNCTSVDPGLGAMPIVARRYGAIGASQDAWKHDGGVGRPRR